MTRWQQSAALTMAAGVILIVGALLPWATLTSGFGSASIAGTDGDGVFAIALGALVAVAGVGMFNGSGTARAGAVVFGVLAAALMVSSFMNISEVVDESEVRASVGIGLWVGLLGGLLAAGAPLMAGSAAKSKSPPAPEGTSG